MSRTSKAAPFYQLQQLDLEVERAIFAAQAINKALEDDTALRAAIQAQDAAQQALKQRQRALRDAEQELESLEARLKSHSERLYGGKVGNPRELGSLQQEVQHLREQRSAQEDHVLEALTAAEEAQAEETTCSARREAIERERQQEQTELRERLRQAETKLAELRQRRQDQAALCDAVLLQRYEQIRKIRAGKAVALAEGGTCQWCRVNLTASDMQRLRTSEEIITCSNCGRMLYLP
jgi:predicted  nucleic acid-binding Zn-ribbon protein